MSKRWFLTLLYLTLIYVSVLPASAQLSGISQDEVGMGAPAAAKEFLENYPLIPYSPITVLVCFDPDLQEEARVNARALIGGRLIHKYTLVPGLELIETWQGVEHAVQFLNGYPGVLYAEYDYVVRKSAIPNDPFFGLLWGLHNTGQTVNGDPGTANRDINAPEAWDFFTGDPNFMVADIDTGMQLNHPDLAANLWANPGEIPGNGIDDDGNGYVDDVNGWDFYSVDNNPSDSDGHGTHTAGTIGAVSNNGIGVVGVNWRCKLIPLRFLGPSGGFISDAVLAVQYCTQKGVKVSNNSWGGGGYSTSLYNAINNAKSVGHLFVCAAGNNGRNIDSSPAYPASYNLDNIISVAATNNDDGRASWSNYGVTSVDLGAPGVTILSTYTGNNYAYMDGTSMASPHVAGVAALVYAQNPTWTYQQVRQRIFSTVRPVASMSGLTVTGGVVNAYEAIRIANNAPTVTITAPANNSFSAFNSPVTFTGSANDTQDGNLSGSLVWTSNLQGQIGTGASFSRSDLIVGTHTITASVTDSGGLPGSAAVTLTITQTVPANPGAVTLTNLGGGSVKIDWEDNSNNETAFDIQRQLYVNGAWTTATIIATVGANVTTHTDSPGFGKVRYRVRAKNSAGSSGWTAWATITLVDTIPNVPGAVTLTNLGGGSVKIDWGDNSNNETAFEVQRMQYINGAWTNKAIIGTVGANVTTYTDNPGTGKVRYQVRSKNSGGSSAWTAWATITL
jgi:subtilisin family serine protease